MGGYGALAIAERNPGLASGVAAISPAIWTSYEQARGANAGAFASARAFAAGDVIANVDKLKGVAIRIASGIDDPFHPGVMALAAVLPPTEHRGDRERLSHRSVLLSQEPPSLHFLSTRNA